MISEPVDFHRSGSWKGDFNGCGEGSAANVAEPKAQAKIDSASFLVQAMDFIGTNSGESSVIGIDPVNGN